jgi:hypothetical protein
MMLVHHCPVGSTWSGGRRVGRNRSERHAESKRGNAHYHLETHGFLLLAYPLLIFVCSRLHAAVTVTPKHTTHIWFQFRSGIRLRSTLPVWICSAALILNLLGRIAAHAIQRL